MTIASENTEPNIQVNIKLITTENMLFMFKKKRFNLRQFKMFVFPIFRVGFIVFDKVKKP